MTPDQIAQQVHQIHNLVSLDRTPEARQKANDLLFGTNLNKLFNSSLRVGYAWLMLASLEIDHPLEKTVLRPCGKREPHSARAYRFATYALDASSLMAHGDMRYEIRQQAAVLLVQSRQSMARLGYEPAGKAELADKATEKLQAMLGNMTVNDEAHTDIRGQVVKTVTNTDEADALEQLLCSAMTGVHLD